MTTKPPEGRATAPDAGELPDCSACPTATTLRARANMLGQILDHAPVMMRQMAADSTIEFVNAAAADELGHSATALTGKKLFDVVAPEERDQILHNMRNIEIGDAYDVQTQSGRTQSWRDFTITDDDGNVVSFISMGDDVTAARAAEEKDKAALMATNRALREALASAETAHRAKATFLAEMSHDLRTPLNAIMGFAQMLAKGEASREKTQSYAQNITDSGETLLELVEKVLDLSAAEAVEILTTQGVVDLLPILQRAARQFHPTLKPGVDFRPTLPKDPIYVRGDPVMLMRALMNVLSNAAKFTLQGWVGLEARMRGTMIQVFVKDTGPGVDPAEIDRILRPFEHGDHGRDAKTAADGRHGKGLGLPIAKKYIEQHGGQLLFRSKPGVGTVVELRLPYAEPTTQKTPPIKRR